MNSRRGLVLIMSISLPTFRLKVNIMWTLVLFCSFRLSQSRIMDEGDKEERQEARNEPSRRKRGCTLSLRRYLRPLLGDTVKRRVLVVSGYHSCFHLYGLGPVDQDPFPATNTGSRRYPTSHISAAGRPFSSKNGISCTKGML